MVTTSPSSEFETMLAQAEQYKAALAEQTQAIEHLQQALEAAQQNQHQLETQIEEQAQMLQYTYEGVGHCVVVIDVLWASPAADPEFRFLSWNVATAKMTGVDSASAVGKTPEELFGPNYGGNVRQNYLRCLAAGKSITYEECIPFDGQDYWWLTTVSPIFDDHGQVHRLVLTTFDITDRKTAEMMLELREAQYRGIFEAVDNGFVILDLTTGEIIEANPAMCQMHGYSQEAFLQLSPADFIHPDSLPMFPDYIETIKSGREFVCEAKDVCKDGSVIDVEVKGIPFCHNNTLHSLAVVRDVSERKAAAAAIAESEAKFRRFVEDANDVIYALDQDGQFTYLSPQFTGLFGHAVSDFLGQSFVPLIHPEDLPKVQTSISTLYTTGQKQTGLEFRLKTGSGVWMWVVCNTCPIKNEDGKTTGLQGIARDVTEQKQFEAALSQKAEELEGALQALQKTQLQMIQSEKMSSLGQLVAGVAHEINNPVGFIYGNLKPVNAYVHDVLKLLELYQRYYPDPQDEIQDEIDALDLEFLKDDLPKTLGSIKMGAERIREIVSSLRTFSRLDEAACKAVDVHAGIDSSLVILRHRLKASAERPAVELVKDYGDLPLVECYAGQLNQVVMNILSNALDALEERDEQRSMADMCQTPSRITISTQQLGCDLISIRITDNGPGIPDSIKDRIFDPFFTTKPVGKGTGMGMSISYQIVTDNHKGNLRCESSANGTTFIIDIPQHQMPSMGL